MLIDTATIEIRIMMREKVLLLLPATFLAIKNGKFIFTKITTISKAALFLRINFSDQTDHLVCIAQRGARTIKTKTTR